VSLPAPDEARLRRDVAILASGPRNQRWDPDALAGAQDHVVAELTAAGWLVEAHPFRSAIRVASNDRADWTARLLRLRPYFGLSGVNVVARHPRSPVGRPVLVGAHLDTVRFSPGADDNASGVAALLEIARLLGTLDAPPAVRLAFFDLEELGLVGSTALARQLPVRAMICLESVGCYRTDDATQRLPTGFGLAFPAAAREVDRGRGDFTLVVHRRSSTAAAWAWQAAAEALGHRAVLLRDPRPDGRAGSVSTAVLPHTVHLDRSDHAPFWRRGVPALLVTDTASFRNPHYHRTGDRPETLAYHQLAQVVTATATAATWWSQVSG
jgi:acetylornithine deacetylase/succinyl-diaminopimelate desuccinylase-like protein